MVGGKDNNKEIPNDRYYNIGKMVELIVQLCCNIYSRREVVIVNSEFCVLQRIIELIKLGFYRVILSTRDSIVPPRYLVIP